MQCKNHVVLCSPTQVTCSLTLSRFNDGTVHPFLCSFRDRERVARVCDEQLLIQELKGLSRCTQGSRSRCLQRSSRR